MERAAIGRAQPRPAARWNQTDVFAILLSLAPVGVLLAVASNADVTRIAGEAAIESSIVVTVIWTALGVMAIALGRSPLARSLALLVFTIPAAVYAVVGPWLAVLAFRG